MGQSLIESQVSLYPNIVHLTKNNSYLKKWVINTHWKFLFMIVCSFPGEQNLQSVFGICVNK